MKIGIFDSGIGGLSVLYEADEEFSFFEKAGIKISFWLFFSTGTVG